MVDFTVSGAAHRPDDDTVLRGAWSVGIVSSTGVAFDGDGSWRAGVKPVATDPTTGAATISLPATNGDYLYVATFLSADYATGQGVALGPFVFDLTTNRTWQSVMEQPTVVPVEPDAVTQLRGMLTQAQELLDALVADQPPDLTQPLADEAAAREQGDAQTLAAAATDATAKAAAAEASAKAASAPLSALAGKADLVGGTVPSSQLPSFVDDVLEFANLAALPATGESGKLYTTLDTNKVYRWSGSGYVVVSDTIALGTTAQTAFRGDQGATAYAHVTDQNNPHGVNKQQIDLGNVLDLSPAQLAARAEFTNAFVGVGTLAPTTQRWTASISNDPFVIPAGTKMLQLRVQGGAGQGGSGRRGAPGTVRCGGGSGSAGGYTEVLIPVADAGGAGATLYVTVGAGGSSGGAAVATDDTNGANGANGVGSLVSTSTTLNASTVLATASGGNAGSGGTATTGAAGGVSALAKFFGAVGAAASTTGGAGNNGTTAVGSPGSGGSGAGLTTANATSAGGNGSSGSGLRNQTAAGGAGGGNTPGADGATPPILGPGYGGGGGGSSVTTASGAGGAGTRGGGGGGGAASTNGFPSGAGGAGGTGYVEIVCYYG